MHCMHYFILDGCSSGLCICISMLYHKSGVIFHKTLLLISHHECIHLTGWIGLCEWGPPLTMTGAHPSLWVGCLEEGEAPWKHCTFMSHLMQWMWTIDSLQFIPTIFFTTMTCLSYSQEMQNMNLMNPKQDMPDLSEMVTNLFGGGAPAPKKKDKAIKGKKKWAEENKFWWCTPLTSGHVGAHPITPKSFVLV